MSELEEFVKDFNPVGLKFQLLLHGTSKYITLVKAVMKDGFIDAPSVHKSDLYAYVLGMYADRNDKVAKLIKASQEYSNFCNEMN